jgi:DNA (cytosine-5)-methyltransferase 1
MNQCLPPRRPSWTEADHAQLPLAASGSPLALDLFAGIGGFSAGFQENGFSVTGVDHEPVAKLVYEAAGFGVGLTRDLSQEMVVKDACVVLGGPPCRPWSAVNLQRRRDRHNDHALLGRFFKNVLEIRPLFVLMENVPALGSDSIYKEGVALLRSNGYDLDARILKYDHYGASTRRRRLFTVGVHQTQVGARSFFTLLGSRRCPQSTVRGAIEWLRDVPCGGVPDHDWSRLQTIGNYRHLYVSGKYGWAQLKYDEPAPSFGSVSKTYILHPEAGDDSFPERVVSVREVLAIMGFDMNVAFPHNTPRAKRYQMAANAVSPAVSRAIASVVHQMITGVRYSSATTSCQLSSSQQSLLLRDSDICS